MYYLNYILIIFFDNVTWKPIKMNDLPKVSRDGLATVLWQHNIHTRDERGKEGEEREGNSKAEACEWATERVAWSDESVR